MRVIARRVPRALGEQAAVNDDSNWRYGALTNTATGQLERLDARHRTQAHVEDRIKELTACGAERLPSTSYARNSAWLQQAALGVSLLAWLRLTALDGDLAKAEPKMLRFRLFAAPARYVRHARTRTLKISTTWPWARDLAAARGPCCKPCSPPEHLAGALPASNAHHQAGPWKPKPAEPNDYPDAPTPPPTRPPRPRRP